MRGRVFSIFVLSFLLLGMVFSGVGKAKAANTLGEVCSGQKIGLDALTTITFQSYWEWENSAGTKYGDKISDTKFGLLVCPYPNVLKVGDFCAKNPGDLSLGTITAPALSLAGQAQCVAVNGPGGTTGGTTGTTESTSAAATADSLYATDDSGMGPCGKNGGTWKFWRYEQNTMAVACGTVLIMGKIANSIVKSAANLLQQTAGPILPGGAKETQASTASNGGISADLFNFLSGNNGDLTKSIEVVVGDTTPASIGTVVTKAYSSILSVVNILLVIFFFILALANILQIQINQYAIKKLLPGLLIGFILANMSLFIVRGGLELSTQLTKQVISAGLSNNSGANSFVEAFTGFPYAVKSIGKCTPGTIPYLTVDCALNSPVAFDKLFKLFVVAFFTGFAGVLLTILGFLFVIRRFVFFFTIPLAPLAFISMYIPGMNTIWSKWWNTVKGWLFMPLVSGFFIMLAMIWFTSFGGGGGITAWMNYVFGIIALYMAIKIPFSMAGEASQVMNKWSNMGKKAWGSTGGAALNAGKTQAKLGAGFVGDSLMSVTGADAMVKVYKKNKENREEGRKIRKEELYGSGSEVIRTREVREKLATTNTEIAALEKSGTNPKRLAKLKGRQTSLSDRIAFYENENAIFERNKVGNQNRKNMNAAGQEMVTALAKEGVSDKQKSIEASIDAIKEETSMLDEVLKNEIKTRKNRMQEDSEAYRQLKVRQVEAQHQMEKGETDKTEKYVKFIESRGDILDKMLESQVQGEVRDKMQKRIINIRAGQRQRETDIGNTVANAVDTAIKTSGSRVDATNWATQLRQLTGDSSYDTLITMAGDPTKDGAAIKAKLASIWQEKYKMSTEAERIMQQRIRNVHNSQVKEDADFYASNAALIASNLFKDNGKKFNLLLNNDFDSLDNRAKPEEINEAVTAWTGMVKSLYSRDADTGVLTGLHKAVADLAASTDPSLATAQQSLEKAARGVGNIPALIDALRKIKDDTNPTTRAKKVNDLEKNYDLGHINLNRGVQATPNAVYQEPTPT